MRWTGVAPARRCRCSRPASVQVTAKLAARELAPQQPGRVERLRVDVLGVAGERERKPRDRRGEPGDGRRAVREVRVQMANGRRLEQPVGEIDGEQELLHVHLARPAEAAAGGRGPPAPAPRGRPARARPDVAGAPAPGGPGTGRGCRPATGTQGSARRCSPGSGSSGLRADLGRSTGWRGGSSAGLITNSRNREARAFEPMDLARR